MHEHDIERELDVALARYTAVEPRDGLEQRVLAHVRLQHTRATRFEWRYLIAAGFVAASLAAFAIWVGGHRTLPLNTGSRPVQYEVASTSAQMLAPTATEAPSHREGMNERTHRTHLTDKSAREDANSSPKPAQFPAPEPLTEQEKLLIQFVEQDPEDAVLVAQETKERLRREREEVEGSDLDVWGEQHLQ